MFMPLADYAPDLPVNNQSNASANIVNAYPRTKESYGPINSLSAYSSNSLAGTCLGAIAVPDNSGNNYIFCGDGTSLYDLAPGSTAFNTLNTGFTVGSGEFWNFTYFAPYVIAVSQGNNTQKFLLGTDTAFANLPGSPPQARYCATIRDFLMLGNTYDSTNGAQPQRVQWSAIGDPTTWPTAGSTTEAQLLAGSQVIPGDQGWIQGIVGNLGTADGAIFFERAVFRVVFAGAPTVFDILPAEGVRGCPAPKSIAQLGANVFYLGEDGFYMFDGSTSTPIGVNRVDKTFFSTVNQGFLYNTVAAVDPVNRAVLWSYASTGSATGSADSVLIYNWALDKWSSANVASEYIFRSISQGYSLEGLDAFPPPNDLDTLPYSLDSREYTGGAITVAAFNSSNSLSLFTGTPLAATMDTVEVEMYPAQETGRGSVPSRHAFVSNTAPMIDGGSPTVQLLGRNNLQATPTTYSTTVIDSDGQCNALAEARFFRGRITTTAGATWNHCQGLQVEARATGQR